MTFHPKRHGVKRAKGQADALVMKRNHPLSEVANEDARQVLARYSAPELKKDDAHHISHLKNAEDEKCARHNLSARPRTMVMHEEEYQTKPREQEILNDHASSVCLDGPPTWFKQAMKDAVGEKLKGRVIEAVKNAMKDAVKDAINEKLDNFMKRIELNKTRGLARAANGYLVIGASIHGVIDENGNVPEHFPNTTADLKRLTGEQ